jgi:hypothetical protein
LTQDELEQLPEWPTGFSIEERLVDGVLRRCPVAPRMVVFVDTMYVTDVALDVWAVGWHEGVQYKRRHL